MLVKSEEAGEEAPAANGDGHLGGMSPASLVGHCNGEPSVAQVKPKRGGSGVQVPAYQLRPDHLLTAVKAHV